MSDFYRRQIFIIISLYKKKKINILFGIPVKQAMMRDGNNVHSSQKSL